MANDHGHERRSQQKLLLYFSAIALRLFLAFAFPSLPDFLADRVEISTPVTNFKRLQEGLYLYNHGASPYDGGVFHQAPLLLAFFTSIPKALQHSTLVILLYAVIDVLAADALCTILATQHQKDVPGHFKSPRKHRAWSEMAVAATYLFNPLIVLTCLGRPTSVFATLFCFLAIAGAARGKLLTSAFTLAIATHLTLQPILLLPPLIPLISSRHAPTDASKRDPLLHVASRYLGAFLLTSALLLGLSNAMLGSWDFIPAVYGTRLLVPDLTPNVGLWWYFFIEMFDSFRSFFTAIFWLHMIAYSPGLAIRLHKQPLAAVILIYGICAIFQPCANIGDAGAWMALLTLYGHVFELTRYMFPALSTLLYSAMFGPVFHYLWTYAGSGNANFFYAITLVWNLGLITLLADMLYAILRDEWEAERPDMKGIEARQI